MLRNTLAHLGGRGFSSIAGLIITTVITAHLGPAAMGIFGIYMVLQNVAGILDGGMSITLNRVMAVGTLDETKDRTHLKLFRTYEVMNAAIGGIFALGTMAALPWVVTAWGSASTENFNLPMIAIFFGAALAIRFMQTLYHNALFGAHQHFAANRVIGSFAIFRSVGILLGLLWFHGSLTTVFIILCRQQCAGDHCADVGVPRARVVAAARFARLAFAETICGHDGADFGLFNCRPNYLAARPRDRGAFCDAGTIRAPIH